MVDHYDLVFFVSVLVELRDDFILLDACAREGDGFPNMKLFILFDVPEVNEEEIGLDSDRQLFCFYGD